jgi:hypothetical protein
MRGYTLTEIELPIVNYCSSYESIAKDIREGIDEGLNEGIKEGIKQGFVAGIRECRLMGFDNIEVKCMEDILKDAFKTSSAETARIRIRHTVSNKYRDTISPSFKQKMEEACDRAVEEIKNVKNADFEPDKRPSSGLKSCVGASVIKIKECIGSAFVDVRKKFSADLVFGSFFDSLQDEFNRDLNENLEVCEKRIWKEIDSKIKQQEG